MKLTVLGASAESNVSLLAQPRSHTAGQERSLAAVWSRDRQLQQGAWLLKLIHDASVPSLEGPDLGRSADPAVSAMSPCECSTTVLFIGTAERQPR